MPAGLGANGPMGSMNMQNIQSMAEAGDPRAIAMLQEMQRTQGGGMPPMQGAAPMPGAGGGMPPPGGAQLSPQGGGAPIPPDVQARRAQQLIQLLRQHQR